jgi:hypothetical protein
MIAIALAKNNLIYGFHFQGNDPNFYLNVQGFLVSMVNDSVYVKPPKKRGTRSLLSVSLQAA